MCLYPSVSRRRLNILHSRPNLRIVMGEQWAHYASITAIGTHGQLCDVEDGAVGLQEYGAQVRHHSPLRQILCRDVLP